MDIKKVKFQANLSIIIFFLSLALYYFTDHFVCEVFMVIGGVGMLFFGQLLIADSVFSGDAHKGSMVSLPPKRDIAKITIQQYTSSSFYEASPKEFHQILKGIYQARPKNTIGEIDKSAECKVYDKWDGEWSLRLIRKKSGQAEFEIDRVTYTGKLLDDVLQLAGI